MGSWLAVGRGGGAMCPSFSSGLAGFALSVAEGVPAQQERASSMSQHFSSFCCVTSAKPSLLLQTEL